MAGPNTALRLQVFENCRLYNPLGTNVRGWGDDLSDSFERAWASSDVESVWQALQDERFGHQVRLWLALHSYDLHLSLIAITERAVQLYKGQAKACQAHSLRLNIGVWRPCGR